MSVDRLNIGRQDVSQTAKTVLEAVYAVENLGTEQISAILSEARGSLGAAGEILSTLATLFKTPSTHWIPIYKGMIILDYLLHDDSNYVKSRARFYEAGIKRSLKGLRSPTVNFQAQVDKLCSNLTAYSYSPASDSVGFWRRKDRVDTRLYDELLEVSNNSKLPGPHQSLDIALAPFESRNTTGNYTPSPSHGAQGMAPTHRTTASTMSEVEGRVIKDSSIKMKESISQVGNSRDLDPKLMPDEKLHYSQRFRQAESDGMGVVTGEDAVKFFDKTELDPVTLGNIWHIADPENRGFLTPSGFSVALRLIGHAQAGRKPTPELALEPGPLPNFHEAQEDAPLVTFESPPPLLPPQTQQLRRPPRRQETGLPRRAPGPHHARPPPSLYAAVNRSEQHDLDEGPSTMRLAYRPRVDSNEMRPTKSSSSPNLSRETADRKPTPSPRPSTRRHTSDLVRDSRLQTEFAEDGVVCHISFESNPGARQRRLRKESKWKRQKKLGAGSFGSVWLHESQDEGSSGKLRAVKQILKQSEGSSQVDYDRELEAIAKFSHSNYVHCFVKSYGWYESDDAIYITMEYLEKGDLQRYISQRFAEIEAREITSQLLEGLSFMHENGFTHRDLKPSNILVLEASPDWWIKISDFGITKRAEEEFTALRTVVGTRGYQAPEVLGMFTPDADDIEEDEYDMSVDMWAVGAIAYRLLTNTMAFEKVTTLGRYVAKRQPFPMTQLEDAGVSKYGKELIERMMAPSPPSRPSAAEAMEHPWREEILAARPAVGITPISHEEEGDQQAVPTARWTDVL